MTIYLYLHYYIPIENILVARHFAGGHCVGLKKMASAFQVFTVIGKQLKIQSLQLRRLHATHKWQRSTWSRRESCEVMMRD